MAVRSDLVRVAVGLVCLGLVACGDGSDSSGDPPASTSSEVENGGPDGESGSAQEAEDALRAELETGRTDIAMSATADVTEARVGDRVRFTISSWDLGRYSDGKETNMSVTHPEFDMRFSGFTWDGATVESESMDLSAGYGCAPDEADPTVITCGLGDATPGGLPLTAVVTLVVTDDGTGTSTLDIVAKSPGNPVTNDPDPTNNTATLTVTIVP